MFNRCDISSCKTIGCSLGEREDHSLFRLVDTVLGRYSGRSKKLAKRVFLIASYSSDVILGVPWMNSRSGVSELGDCPTRFDTCDSTACRYCEDGCPFFINSASSFSQGVE